MTKPIESEWELEKIMRKKQAKINEKWKEGRLSSEESKQHNELNKEGKKCHKLGRFFDECKEEL